MGRMGHPWNKMNGQNGLNYWFKVFQNPKKMAQNKLLQKRSRPNAQRSWFFDLNHPFGKIWHEIQITNVIAIFKVNSRRKEKISLFTYYMCAWEMRKCEKAIKNIFSITFFEMQLNIWKYFMVGKYFPLKYCLSLLQHPVSQWVFQFGIPTLLLPPYTYASTHTRCVC